MFKKLDWYIIKTFFGPFIFIFSVLFFIFIVNIIWIQLGQFLGKGLSYWEILKLLFYMGVSVITLVLPLTILLSSIMTFGTLGEQYELAAMKAAGISLTRIMLPLFFTVSFLAVLLFFFSNNIIPDFQRKAKNMFYNIAATKPALNFTPGQFIDQIPGFQVKFDKITGEKGERIEGVFVHKKANSYEDQQSIVAKRGKFTPGKDKNYLKLVLYDGYIFDDNISNKDYRERQKQPDQSIKFDTLVSHFDISELIKNALEDQKITDDYRFENFTQLNKTIVQNRKDNKVNFSGIGDEFVSQTNNYISYVDVVKSKKPVVQQIKLDTVKEKNKLDVLLSAYTKIQNLKNVNVGKQDQILQTIKYYSRVVMYQQRIFAYSFTCIIFFLIGASLGSIIRKGGLGLPVVMAIIVFIIFYVINLTVENLAWTGKFNPYTAAWLPNIVLFPFGVWLTYKALTDSQVFDAEKYKSFFKPLISFLSKRKEHERYQ
ncbi:LptF/LptG family permease [Halpernia frigidisoli]|uniref:Lipopolysaccharide export system permease protein n=1 Tax=Halpernia frigidisoli TaxID=1125876 RepID=A0A1I3D6F0_9FLAO|nr:LptF/LptG family permease [Halpernia frigidisoli]SFH82149.1 lipopolysaccharide export system permease protein [Halpernia frigidisoli]